MTIHRSIHTGRVRVDLRTLPRRLALAIGAAVAAGVGLAAWWVGRDDPVPAWISDRLVPALGWAYLVLVLVAAIAVVRRRRRAKGDEK